MRTHRLVTLPHALLSVITTPIILGDSRDISQPAHETFPRASVTIPYIADAGDYTSVVDSNDYDSLFSIHYLDTRLVL